MAQVLIDYIRQNGLDALTKNFAINLKRHGKYPNLVLCKYDQIDSPMGNPVVQECRGIILDEAADWHVVSYPYRKFFNYGEGHAAQIDWSTARVYEKLDGSLMTLYWYDGHWEVSSSGMPDAAGTLMGTETTFGELFWKVWKELGYEMPHNENLCYMFELCTPFNRVVVKHAKNDIVLHGARSLAQEMCTDGTPFKGFKEFNPIVVAHQHNWHCVPTYPLQSWDDVTAFAAKFDPMEHEGFVVCDENYNRVKVKSPAYVAVAHMRDGFTTRRMLEIVRTNESSEFLSYYPEFTSLYHDIKAKYERLLGQVEGFYEAIKDIDEHKKFAMKAKDHKQSGLLFSMHHGKIESFKQGIAEVHIRTLEEWLGVKSMEL